MQLIDGEAEIAGGVFLEQNAILICCLMKTKYNKGNKKNIKEV